MDFSHLNQTVQFLIGLGVLLGGGVASFFIIKSSVKKSLEDTVKVLQGEINVYKH